MYSTTIFTAVLVALISLTAAHEGHVDEVAKYTLTDDLSYENFFKEFEFFDGPDPTEGFVKYQNQEDAVKRNLVGYLPDTQSVFMGVDCTTKDPAGRASVRLESKKSWNYGLLIADIRHMPPAIPGVWPALWLLSSSAPWPIGGEVDLLEGVNEYTTNSVTLHTSAGCMVDNTTSGSGGGSGATGGADAPFTGLLSTDDCDVAAPGQGKNVGCSIRAPDTMPGLATGGSGADSIAETPLPSYGTEFNKAGGGIYAMDWTAESISVWFFPYNSPGFTEHFSSKNTSIGTTSPDPSAWGTPIAHFGGSGCDFGERFMDLKIIFNTALCGQWAGADNEWAKTSAAKAGVATCNEYVRDHPEAFIEAYWEVAGLKWFQKGAAAGKRDTIAPLPKHDGDSDVPISFVKAKGRRYAW
jgi:hypothetical protein